MFKIQTLNAISDVIHNELSAGLYTVAKEEPIPDGILVRSANMHEMPLGDNLLAIARAGAGVNNIPIDACSKAGIVVFNTPGANANAVAELVMGRHAAGQPEYHRWHCLGAEPSGAGSGGSQAGRKGQGTVCGS